jgi:hypothetical protein
MDSLYSSALLLSCCRRRCYSSLVYVAAAALHACAGVLESPLSPLSPLEETDSTQISSILLSRVGDASSISTILIEVTL